MNTQIGATLALMVAVLLVLRFRRGDLDEDSQAALAREELRARRLIVQSLIVGALGTVGLTTYGAVKITTTALQLAATQEVPVSESDQPTPVSIDPDRPPAPDAPLEERVAFLWLRRAQYVQSIANNQVQLVGTTGSLREWLEANAQESQDRIDEIDRELSQLGGTR